MKQRLVLGAVALLGFAVTMGGCVRGAARASENSFESAGDLQSQLDACRREHERQVSSAEVETLRAELRRYVDLADRDARRRAAMKRAMDEYSHGVCLIHGIFTMVQERDGQEIEVADSDGNLLRLEYLGSGFLTSDDGNIVTNRHVAEPWWNNESVAPLLQRGPGNSRAIAGEADR